MTDLFDFPHYRPSFDGKTYEPKQDHRRLGAQFIKVFNVMEGGEWQTLSYLRAILGFSEASISARLRDFRKKKFGGHTVLRERIKGGQYQYRLLINPKDAERGLCQSMDAGKT